MDGEEVTIDEWAKNFSDIKDRRIGRTETPRGTVSTVLLGVDHNFSGVGPPVIFETMVFLKDGGEECERYHTKEEAEKGHKTWVVAMGGEVGVDCANCGEMAPPKDYLCKNCRTNLNC